MLLTELSDGVLTLRLNRPDKRNALSAALLGLLSRELERADLDADVRVVVIRGEGKDFCAGADLDELLASADRTPAENEAAALVLGDVFIQMRKIPKPVVAVIHGRALAGGAGLVTGCDIALAMESARLGYPEIQRGFVPAMVMTMLRRAVGEKIAFDLAATGRVLTATEAMTGHHHMASKQPLILIGRAELPALGGGQQRARRRPAVAVDLAGEAVPVEAGDALVDGHAA